MGESKVYFIQLGLPPKVVALMMLRHGDRIKLGTAARIELISSVEKIKKGSEIRLINNFDKDENQSSLGKSAIIQVNTTVPSEINTKLIEIGKALSLPKKKLAEILICQELLTD